MTLADGDRVDVSALAYARGHAPEAVATLRACPHDFRVDEDCAIALSGYGEHLWCWIEKTGLTTQNAVQALSRAAGVHPRHIGFAGLKDRHAVTRQWLSLAWPVTAPLPDLDEIDGLQVLQMHRHERKLKRGAHRGNRFAIRLRQLEGNRALIEADLQRVPADGVPNYFGAQRFGRDGRNLALSRALFDGRRLSRNRRGFALSAARSLLFNAVLDRRVRERSWNRLVDGEAVMLDGSQSVFSLSHTDQSPAELDRRLHAFDIHPSGPLPGRGGEDVVSGQAAALERDTIGGYADLAAGLEAAGIDAHRRALRVAAREFEWVYEDDAMLVLRFWLPSGAFATSVLREFVHTRDAGTYSDSGDTA